MEESAKLRVLRALVHYVPRALCACVPYVLACPTCLRALHASCTTCLRALHASCPGCLRALHTLCPTCSRAPRASCLTYSRVSCASLFTCFLPSVPYIHDKDNNVEMFSKYEFVLITFTLNLYLFIYPSVYLSIYLTLYCHQFCIQGHFCNPKKLYESKKFIQNLVLYSFGKALYSQSRASQDKKNFWLLRWTTWAGFHMIHSG